MRSARRVPAAPGLAPALTGLVLAAALPNALAAQRPTTPARPPSGTGVGIGGTGGDTTRAPGDTARRPAGLTSDSLRVRRDSAAADSALVTFAEDDSTIAALRARPGYDVVRYQGDTVRFLARERLLTLRGKPAAVERGTALLVGRNVRYDDSLRVVTASADSAGRARGDSAAAADSVVLRDPSQGSDVVVRDEIRYNLDERRGIVRGFSTSVAQGEEWFVRGGVGAIVSDTGRAAQASGGRTFYAHDGNVTSCDEESPHYHFQARDIKFVSRSLLVIRPAVLYIGNVPVMWLPFVFQDTRPGRRSGLLRPQFGVAELLRNSPNYQRSIRNLGYYTTLGDYADVRAWVDFRSGARPNAFGFGSMGYNVQSAYKWIDRFVDGNVALKHERLSTGERNSAVSWQHAQSFNASRKVSANINYTQNTSVQRRNQFNPNAVLGTITSAANLSDRFGPVALSLGGTGRQYPGRQQRELNFPNLNLTTQTVAVTPWLDWTPTFSLDNQQTFRLDQGVQFTQLYSRRADGTLDSTRVRAQSRNTSMRFDTPVKIRGFQWSNTFTFTENLRDYPTLINEFYRDIRDSTTREPRVFAQTFQSNLDWNTSFSLPGFFQGTWNLTPSVSLTNVDQAGLLFRTERSGGRWISGRKRVSYAVSAAPTFYAFAPGVFGAERFRHSISPTVSFSYSPTADVSDAYLAAIGSRRQGYFAGGRQNRVSLGITTNLEAKLRAPRAPAAGPADSAAAGAPGGPPNGATPGAPAGRGALAAGAAPRPAVEPLSGGSANAEGRKVKVASLQFTTLNYDFARSDTVTGRWLSRRGFVDESFGISATSDLLPGFSFRQNYSLFRGNPVSDTAVFKPYRTSTDVSFQLDRSSALLGAVTRLFGIDLARRAGPSATPTQNAPGSRLGGDPAFAAAALASRPAGSDPLDSRFGAPTQDFQLSLTYTSQRQRNDITGTLVDINQTLACTGLTGFTLVLCEQQALQNPTAGDSLLNSVTRGASIFRTPPVRTLSATSSFHITQKWSANWQTTYDIVRRQFATNVVNLSRELHDWRANFGYTAAPNGNSAFTFFIALKAQPDLSFPYNRQTTRSAR